MKLLIFIACICYLILTVLGESIPAWQTLTWSLLALILHK